MAELLKTEQQLSKGRNKLLELFTVPRNRRAMVASEIVMFMQVCSTATFSNTKLTSRSNSAE